MHNAPVILHIQCKHMQVVAYSCDSRYSMRRGDVMNVRNREPVPVGKQGRQQLICDLIATQEVHSHEQLVELLAERGVETTQTTLSRDLTELKVYKGPNGYALPNTDLAPAPTTNELKRALETLLV